MIFIIGGASQGKQTFARKKFPERTREKAIDGETASWEEFLAAGYVKNLHRMIWRQFEKGETWEKLEKEMAGQMISSCPDRIVLSNEIGCGIVPENANQRAYRESAGRIYCQLAAYSTEVWRVFAGIGQMISQDERQERRIFMADANVTGMYGINPNKIAGETLNEIREQTAQAVREFFAAAKLRQGQIFVVGCSSSEIVSSRIGSYSSKEIGETVFQSIWEECRRQKIFLAAQCCEHLNRALILEREAAERYGIEIVNVVPQLKAGGSFATAAYYGMREPVAAENIAAHGGMDIGDTLIGMHLRSVAVPVRIATKQIGKAHVVCARVRAKFIGGERAYYDKRLI